MGIIEMMTCAAGEIIFSIFTFTPERPQFPHAEYDTKKKQKLQTKKNNPVRFGSVKSDFCPEKFSVKQSDSVPAEKSFRERISSAEFLILFLNFSRRFFQRNHFSVEEWVGYFEKYSAVVFATTELITRSETQFGIAMSPFVMSAMVKTAFTVKYGPMATKTT